MPHGAAKKENKKLKTDGGKLNEAIKQVMLGRAAWRSRWGRGSFFR